MRLTRVDSASEDTCADSGDYDQNGYATAPSLSLLQGYAAGTMYAPTPLPLQLEVPRPLTIRTIVLQLGGRAGTGARSRALA